MPSRSIMAKMSGSAEIAVAVRVTRTPTRTPSALRAAMPASERR